MTIANIRLLYPNQWVVVNITQENEYGFPSEGEVLVSSLSEEDAIERFEEYQQIENTKKYRHLYFFYTN